MRELARFRPVNLGPVVRRAEERRDGAWRAHGHGRDAADAMQVVQRGAVAAVAQPETGIDDEVAHARAVLEHQVAPVV